MIIDLAYYFCLLTAIFVWPVIIALFEEIIQKERTNPKCVLFLSAYMLALIISFYH